MAVDWVRFLCDLDSVIISEEKRTDDRLSSRLSSVTRMKNDEVDKALFPERKSELNTS